MGRTGLGVRVTTSYRKKNFMFHGSGKGAYDLAWGGGFGGGLASCFTEISYPCVSYPHNTYMYTAVAVNKLC